MLYTHNIHLIINNSYINIKKVYNLKKLVCQYGAYWLRTTLLEYWVLFDINLDPIVKKKTTNTGSQITYLINMFLSYGTHIILIMVYLTF